MAHDKLNLYTIHELPWHLLLITSAMFTQSAGIQHKHTTGIHRQQATGIHRHTTGMYTGIQQQPFNTCLDILHTAYSHTAITHTQSQHIHTQP